MSAPDYAPRPYFTGYHARDKRWSCIVAHRRAGKTVATVFDLLTCALGTAKQNARYAYIAPFYSQAKAVAWDYLKRFSAPIAARISESELAVDLHNGSRVRLFGADNPDALRGIYLDGVVLDEYGDQRPTVWGEIIRPLLTDRKGWATFIGTPKGRNHFYDIREQAQASHDWLYVELRASETGALAEEELADAKRTMTDAQYQQEFECAFDVPALGAIYAREYQQARDDKRITRVPYDPLLQVSTFWDLGIGDSTAIWFAQRIGSEVRVIDYYEANGYGLDHYVGVLKGKPYVYAEDWVPHDAQAKQLTSGKSTIEILRTLGRNAKLVPKLGLEEGINAARMIFPRCWFDETKTARGLECLQNYRREMNDKLGEFRATPVHDWASHGCFHGETKVWTRYGMRPIMSLPYSGEVMTPCGWKPYVAPRITKRSAQLVEVVFASGYSVKCTPDHLFLTDGGWTSAESLTRNTMILSSWTRSRSISTAVCTVFGRLRSTTPAAARSCIVRLGLWPLVKSLRDAISITGTVIQRTTRLPTLSACLHQSTCQNQDQSAALSMDSGSLTQREKKRQSGTSQRPEGYGTADTPSVLRVGRSGSGKTGHAAFVGACLARLFAKVGTQGSFAPQHARPLRIERVEMLNEVADVWDITVPEGNWFALSNGATVHNSDAFRYLAVAIDKSGAKPKLEPIRYSTSGIV